MSSVKSALNSTDATDDQRLAQVHKLFFEAQNLLRTRQSEEALIVLRKILVECPDQPDALNLASVALGQLKMFEEAERLSREALRQRPDDPGFLLNLGNRLNDRGRRDEACELYRRAAAAAPDDVAVLRNHLDSLIADECWADAMPLAEKLSSLAGDNAELLEKCALVCVNHHDLRKALEIYQAALALEPDHVPWLLQTARLAMHFDQLELAYDVAEHVLELEEQPEMRALLASIMHRRGKLDEMAEHLEAIPDNSDQAANAANLLGMMMTAQAKSREGLDVMAKTKELAPDDFTLQCTRMMFLNYDAERSREAIRDEHMAFGQTFDQALPLLGQAWQDRTCDPDRKLHIGFVSPDLGSHSVVYFLRPFLDVFDRDRFDVTAYASLPKEDALSDALKTLVTRWRNVFHLNDQSLADVIREDRVDILIDLAGLTKGTRLRAFTARPAPVQMTYIGYPNTTGLAAVDYRITDVITDPDGSDDDYVETLIRLPDCFLCYAVPGHAPPVQPGPVESRGYITFGTFNNFAKINDQVLDLWGRILSAVPGSRLLAKSSSSCDPTGQQTIRSRLERHGIEPGRVQFADYVQSLEGHLALYHDIDIALDTFPYNGTTTTCEALWMGVPVVTLLGDRHAARVSASLLNAIRFPAGIAESPDDYVLTAKLLAENPGLLKVTRRSLRNTMVQSPLCDNRKHTHMLETAFRTVWTTWCEQQAAAH